MKRVLPLLVLCCLASSAAFGQNYKIVGTDQQIAVGPDGNIRVIWSEVKVANSGSGYYQIDTYTPRLGTPSVAGMVYGPEASGWNNPQIAVGPNNDTHIGWLNNALGEFSIWNLTNSNTVASNPAMTDTFTLSGTTYGPVSSLLNVSMDSNDNLWFNGESFGTAGLNTSYLWPYTSSGAQVQSPEPDEGYTDYENFQNGAIRNDGTPQILGTGDLSAGVIDEGSFGPNLNTMYVNQIVSTQVQLGLFFNLFGYFTSHAPVPATLSPFWSPARITTTANNHTQIWWISENATSQDIGIWDIAPNGTLNLSPLITAPNTWILSAAANPFAGGNNLVYALYYVGTYPNQSYELVSYDTVNGWNASPLTLATTN